MKDVVVGRQDGAWSPRTVELDDVDKTGGGFEGVFLQEKVVVVGKGSATDSGCARERGERAFADLHLGIAHIEDGRVGAIPADTFEVKSRLAGAERAKVLSGSI